MKNKEIKLSLLADSMSLYVGQPGDTTDRPQRLLRKSNHVAKY